MPTVTKTKLAEHSAIAAILQSRWAIFAAYFCLTAAMTYPLLLTWRTALPAGAGDIWQNYWNFWWWKHCLLNGLSPLQSSMLFHPWGTDLVFHTHSPFNQVIAMPVNLLLGEAAAYNFCIFVALTLTGFGTYLLVTELTGSRASGFLAGLIFAYFPQTLEQTLEHLNLFSVQFIPLSLFYLLRWSRGQGRSSALAFGICFGLNALCSWHLGLKLGLVVTPWIAWLAWQRRRQMPSFLKDLGMAAAVALLLALPTLAPMLALIGGGAEYYLKNPVPRGIDPSYLLTPAYANPVFGTLVQSRYLERAYQASGFICYLGLLPLSLAAISLWRAGRRACPWACVFLSGLVLALGAHLLWDGTYYDSVPLPFQLLSSFPFLENLRVANRFLLLAGLGLAVLAGLGWKSLRLKSAWALPVAAAIILAEYSWTPFPLREVEHSALLSEVSARPGAVLDIPFHQRSRTVHNMVAQTVHERPISGGYLSSYPPETEDAVRGEPALGSLAGLPAPDVTVDVDRLRALGYRTVIIHKYRTQSFRDRSLAEVAPGDLLKRKQLLRTGGIPDSTVAAIRDQLDQAVGEAALEDDRLAIYFL